jgi:hypothetical protein
MEKSSMSAAKSRSTIDIRRIDVYVCAAAMLAAVAPTSARPEAAGRSPASAATLSALVERLTAERRVMPPAKPAPALAASVAAVTSCADDGGFDTLRHAVLTANTGDTIDLSGLPCNQITLQSGPISVDVADLTIAGPGASRFTIDGNNAGRVFTKGGTGTLTLTDLTVAHGKFEADKAYGGCIYSKGSVTLNRSVVTSCTALGQSLAIGGGILSFVDVTLNESTVSNNTANAQVGADATEDAVGGGIFTVYHLRLVGSTLSGNVSEAPTGKVYAGGAFSGSLTVKYSTVSGNETKSAGDAVNLNFSAGGGLVSSPDALIVRSTIDHNKADAFGGLRLSTGTSTASIIQTTISSNTGTLGVGAIYVGGKVSIFNSTIAFNVSGSLAPANVLLGDTPTLQSTIIADNSPVDIDGGGMAAGGHNLIKVSGSNITVPAGTIALDPNLAALAFNGGVNRTHAIGAGSPALGAGANPSNFTTDQRGPPYKRKVGAVVDIGAYEFDAGHIFGNGFDLD